MLVCDSQDGAGEKDKRGGRCLPREEALGGRDLSGMLSQAKDPYVSPQIEPALPPPPRAFS